MTVVNPKSISGINSITTGSGSDNLLTIHTSDANNTERFRIDSTGATKIVTGIVTTLTATTGIVTTLTSNTTTLNSTTTATGNINISGANITLQDSGSTSDDRITLGAGPDMQLYHNGTDSVLTNATGDLYINNNGGASDDIIIKASDDIYLQPQDGESGVSIIGDGAVELYHNNSKKFETSSSGVTVTGGLTATTGAFTDDVTVTGDKLKVLNASAPQMRVNSDTSDGASTRITIGQATATNNFVNGSASGDSVITFGTNLLFGVQTSEKVRIDSSGRLLIGGTSHATSASVRTLNLIATSTTEAAIVLSRSNSLGGSTAGRDIKLETNGDLTINTHNVGEKVRFLNAGGITFNGDTATANALDDYEEGTWTPTQPTIGTNSASGTYTKIGRYVFASMFLTLPTNSSGQPFYIDSLPFTALNNSGTNIHGGYAIYTTYGSPITVRVHDNGTRCQVSAIGGGNINLSGLDNLNFRLAVHYMTN